MHVTLRAGLGPLRSQLLFPTLRLAILRANRRAPERFRIVEFSIQRDHVHLIVEAADKHALSTGLRGFTVRAARYVNDLLLRRGPFWADRWFARALRSPREVRNGLAYVLTNFRKHACVPLAPGIDPYSTGAWFEGWSEWHPGSGSAAVFAERSPPGVAVEPGQVISGREALERPSAPARTWLLRAGWRRCGRIGLAEKVHATKRRRSPPSTPPTSGEALP